MKKILGVFIVLLFSFILIGCDEATIVTQSYEVEGLTLNDNENMRMTIVEGTVTPKGLKVEFYYGLENSGLCGESYTLYVYQNDEWAPLSYVVEENVAFTSIGYGVNRSFILEIDWEWLYGDLPPGRYLIIKTLMDFRESGDYTNYQLAAEFSIE